MKLRVEKPIYGGAGLARVPDAGAPAGLAGKAVFVPLTLPGELVEASVRSDRRGYITGQLESVLEPANERVPPGCEYYARCGGCHYQHASYPAQLEMKRAILLETLERAHVPAPSDIRVLAGEPWGYRNRIRLHVRDGGSASLCYREAASHRDLAVDRCPVAAPLLQQTIAGFNRFLQSNAQAARQLSEVELFCNAEESALLVSLFVEQARTADGLPTQIAAQLGDALRIEAPALEGVCPFAIDQRTRRIQSFAPEGPSTWGTAALAYDVDGVQYRVSAGAFFQVNRFLAPALVEAVCAQRQGAVAWDLYAGVGLFAKVLAQRFDRVIAVESAPASSVDLRHNLRQPHCECVATDTLRFLRARAKGSPDLLVVDPPRAGLGAEVCTLMAAAAPRQIVYVSCDPSTLTRDVRALQPSGYRPVDMTLIDLFPQTFHLETVTTLERS